MPQVAAVIAAKATAFFIAATGITSLAVAQFVYTAAYIGANILISAGITTAISAATGRPKPASVANPGQQLQFGSNPNAPRQIVYGETAVAGQIILSRVTNNDKYLHLIAALGDGGPYSSIQSIQLNGETVTLDGSGNITSPSKWASKARIETKLGSLTQTAFSTAVSELSDWTSDHTGKGVALAYLRFEYDPEVWTSGSPSPLFIVRGRSAIYDPRLDSSPGNDPTNASYQAWTQNPALWALDFIRGVYINGQRIAGLGVPDALIDWDSFADAADVCDENVGAKAGGNIARYSCGGGVVSADDDPISVLDAMLSSMAGTITTRSGLIACYAGEAQTAAVTLDDDDWAGPVKIVSGVSVRDTANAVNPQYREPDLGYEWTGAPPYRNSTWETEDDGEELWTELQLPFVDDHRVAQRLAKIFAGERREPHQLEATCKIKAMQILEGQVFTLDSDSYGSAVNGKYKLVKRTVNPDGTVAIVARSETDAKYAWTPGTDERDAPGASVTTPAVPSTPTPTGWTAAATEYNGPQGSATTFIDVAISGTIPETVGFVEIEYKRQEGETLGLDFLGDQYGSAATAVAGDSQYVPVATLTRAQAASGYRISGIERARGYSVRVRYLSYFSLAGAYQTIETSVGQASGVAVGASGWSGVASTVTGAEGYTRPVLAMSAPSDGVPAEVAVVSLDYRKLTDNGFTGQVVLTRADASRGYSFPAELETDYLVRVRYGADAASWGPEQFVTVSTSASAAISLTTFAVASNDTGDGTYSLPGFRATWDALSGDSLRRANAITVQYRRNGDTNVSTLTAEPDATSVAAWGLLPGVTYNVRARVEEVYQNGAWTAWTDVTLSTNQIVRNILNQGGLATEDNADWDTSVSNRPTALTDGRVAAALNASGVLQTNIPNASQIPTLTLAKISDAGSLASLNTVAASQIDTNAVTTEKIAANAVTRGAPATASSDRATAGGITVELVSITTGTLVSGSAVDIAVDFGSASLFGTAANIFIDNTTAGNVDVNLNLYRDYGGGNELLLQTIPVRLTMPTGTSSTLTSATTTKFRVTDTSPAASALTYSVRLESEVTGGSPITIDMGWTNLLRIISYVERKA